MNPSFKTSGFFAALCVGFAVLPVAAKAAIACRDGNQLVAGQEISTPFCQDELLAEVARSYGMKTSGHQIRENPNYKRDVCRFIGRDYRAQQACAGFPTNGRRSL